MSHDNELLRRFVEEGAEAAFAELVREHLGLVYSAAVREMNGDTGLAEDISQAVFTELASKAPRLLAHPSLAGWLYLTVRNLAANLRRSEHHRRRREEEAMKEMPAEDTPSEAWQRMRPVLDDALHELKADDREAVVLHFLEERPLREVGLRLGLSENAARMRVDRALEKLRGKLARRGVVSTASGLTAALAVGVLVPVPSGLSATITAGAIAGGVSAVSTGFSILKLMSLSKLNVGLVGALVVAGISVPVWQQTQLHRVRAENVRLHARESEIEAQESEVLALQEQVEKLRKASVDQDELKSLRKYREEAQPELLRLRSLAGVARRANAELEELRARLASKPSSESETNPLSSMMGDAMKTALDQQVEGRVSRLVNGLHLTPEQAQAAREILQKQSKAMSAGMTQMFAGKFDPDAIKKAGQEAGNPEREIKALLTPEQTAAYPAYEKSESAYNANLISNSELLQLSTTLGLNADQQDRAFAALYDSNLKQITPETMPPFTNQIEAMQWQLDEKAKALEPVLTPAQLESYRQQQAAQLKMMQGFMSKLNK